MRFESNTWIVVKELQAQMAGLSEVYQRRSEQLDRMIQLLEQWAPSTALPTETTPISVFSVVAISVEPFERATPSVPTISAEAPRQGGQLTAYELWDIIDRLSQFRQVDLP